MKFKIHFFSKSRPGIESHYKVYNKFRLMSLLEPSFTLEIFVFETKNGTKLTFELCGNFFDL